MEILKLVGMLRNYTTFKPTQRNKLCWSSPYEMLTRYIEFQPFLPHFQDDDSLIDYFLTSNKKPRNSIFSR